MMQKFTLIHKLKKWEIPITITLLFFGILLSVQFNTQQELLNSLEKQNEQDLVAVVKNLNDKRAALQVEIEDLLKQKTNLVDKAASGDSVQSTIENDLKELRKANGTTALEGPGVSISITTSDNSIMYLDLVDIINELWAIGAEAISVNDIRINNETKINDVLDGNKTMVAVNGKKLLSPIIIKAIGDPKALDAGLNLEGGVIYSLSTLYNIRPEIREETKLTIPAATK